MIFNNEKVLYWAKSKGEFEVRRKEELRKTDCYNIAINLLSLGFLELVRVCGGDKYYKITKKGEHKLLQYQKFYKKNKEGKKPEVKNNLDSFMDNDTVKENKVYSVYKGMHKTSGEIVYIGTTVQLPKNRFRWHKSNGKDLNFKVIHKFDNSNDMLQKEFKLIKELKPKLNKITSRPQNLNVKLTSAELEKRVNDKEWCQSCLRRRARKGLLCGYC
tara:strand:+ start:37738 stop:38385 length:648 start_codon:yes stop_codon:yes gene_type:complete